MARIDVNDILRSNDPIKWVNEGKQLAENEFTIGSCFKLIDVLLEKNYFNEAIEIAQYLYNKRGDRKDITKLATAIYKSRNKAKLEEITKELEKFIENNSPSPQLIHRLVVNYRVFDRDDDSLELLERNIYNEDFYSFPPFVTDYGDFLNKKGMHNKFISYYENLPNEIKQIDRVKKEYILSLIHIGKLKEAETLLNTCNRDNIYNSRLSEINKLKRQLGVEAYGEKEKMSLIPEHIQPFVNKMRNDFPIGKKLCFIVMKFEKTNFHDQIVSAIKNALIPYNIIALRADDKQYSDDLSLNVLSYIYFCDFAVAVFERLTADDFNPNVSYEVGYLSGLGKEVCFLKDKTLRYLHTDLVGKLYKDFDPQNPDNTIPPNLMKWLQDKGIMPKV